MLGTGVSPVTPRGEPSRLVDSGFRAAESQFLGMATWNRAQTRVSVNSSLGGLLILEGHAKSMIDESISRFHTGEPENTTLTVPVHTGTNDGLCGMVQIHAEKPHGFEGSRDTAEM